MSNPFFSPCSALHNSLQIFKITILFSFTSSLTGLPIEPVMPVICSNGLNYVTLYPLFYGLCELQGFPQK
jgi:hypothetical protein